MNKRIKKKIAKRKQNEELVEWVKAFIGSRMADAVLNELFGAIVAEEPTPDSILTRVIRQEWHESIFRRNNNE